MCVGTKCGYKILYSIYYFNCACIKLMFVLCFHVGALHIQKYCTNNLRHDTYRVHPKNYAHSWCFVVICCVLPLVDVTHMHCGYFTGTGAIIPVPSECALLFQVMACRLFGAKPFPEPKLHILWKILYRPISTIPGGPLRCNSPVLLRNVCDVRSISYEMAHTPQGRWGHHSNIETIFPGMVITIINTRQPWNHFNFILKLAMNYPAITDLSHKSQSHFPQCTIL